VLVCAASNVAVDNILARVKDDVPLVRLGIASNDEAQLFSIDDELNSGQYAAELQLKYKELVRNSDFCRRLLRNNSVPL
jgi:superfamily I DNA and/or RNA helicase